MTITLYIYYDLTFHLKLFHRLGVKGEPGIDGKPGEPGRMVSS